MTPTPDIARSRHRNERRELDRRVETAREGFKHLSGLLVAQQAEFTRLRTDLDAAIHHHEVVMTVAAIALDATNLIEVGE